jgi:hypothetical protein
MSAAQAAAEVLDRPDSYRPYHAADCPAKAAGRPLEDCSCGGLAYPVYYENTPGLPPRGGPWWRAMTAAHGTAWLAPALRAGT